MTGVNELALKWENEPCGGGDQSCGVMDCVRDLDDTARTAWHPVSRPPTEADADDWGFVAFLTDEGFVVTEPYWEAPGTACMWARIRDVVLLPQSTGDEA